MKKLFAIIALVGVLASSSVFAQDTTATEPATETTQPAETASVDTSAPEEEATFHELLKDLFIAGGPGFMTPILVCLIIGLAISIERIIILNLATTNTRKLLGQIEDAISK